MDASLGLRILKSLKSMELPPSAQLTEPRYDQGGGETPTAISGGNVDGKPFNEITCSLGVSWPRICFHRRRGRVCA